MELLLNLAWLLLALPAYWLWRRNGVRGLARRSSLRSLLTLAWALVLLFPVISASDDLHAMQAEMEESATIKRAVRHAGSDKNSAVVHRLQGSPAMAATAPWLPVQEVRLLEVSVISSSPLARRCIFHAGRAPPIDLFA